MRRGGGSGVAFLSSNGLNNLVRNSQMGSQRLVFNFTKPEISEKRATESRLTSNKAGVGGRVKPYPLKPGL